MQLIKDQKIIDDPQQFIADDQPLPSQGNITVSLARWQKDRTQLLKTAGKLGVRLEPTDATATIADDLSKLALVEVNFPLYTDGRAFSHARHLRHHYRFQGEIRAVGQFMADQVFYLSRVGVNSFQLADTEKLPIALSTLKDFSSSYQ
ncbi:MAG: DUF934 domain-containing protein [Methylococcaceae bacterium]|nr:DUF934 domain-containing protein [Methylococcaceae bacterium]